MIAEKDIAYRDVRIGQPEVTPSARPGSPLRSESETSTSLYLGSFPSR